MCKFNLNKIKEVISTIDNKNYWLYFIKDSNGCWEEVILNKENFEEKVQEMQKKDMESDDLNGIMKKYIPITLEDVKEDWKMRRCECDIELDEDFLDNFKCNCGICEIAENKSSEFWNDLWLNQSIRNIQYLLQYKEYTF